MTPHRRRISIFIVAVLGLQAVPVAREFTGARETLWPFFAWGMFRHASEPPVETVVFRLFATTRDAVRPVGSADAGFDPFTFRRWYKIPIAEGDSAAAADLTRRLSRRWRAPVRGIVVGESVYRLSDDGVRQSTTLRRFEAKPR